MEDFFSLSVVTFLDHKIRIVKFVCGIMQYYAPHHELIHTNILFTGDTYNIFISTSQMESLSIPFYSVSLRSSAFQCISNEPSKGTTSHKKNHVFLEI